MTTNILRIDGSARRSGSVSRGLIDQIVERFDAAGDITLTTRDLADPLPLLTEEWIDANFTAASERTAQQQAALKLSDDLVDELRTANIILIGLPIYNFGVPGTLKAWIDLISRAGETFRYTEDGPIGLLTNKRAIVAVASGGTEAGSEIDFATGYLKHVLGFVGITDVLFVNADKMVMDGDASLARAARQIDALELAA